MTKTIRTRWALAFALAATPAVALAEPPTLNGLFQLPVQDAAAVALGPGPEVFVERSPWNAIELNFVLNTGHLFGMSFFTRAEQIAPRVCAVTLGSVTFDTLPPPEASAEEKAAAAKLPFGRRSLRWLGFQRSRRYFAVGPAPAKPASPGGPPAPLSASQSAVDSCENPVSARTTFVASAPETAIAAVNGLETARSAARSEGPLPFELTSECGADATTCADAREQLGALKPQAIQNVDAQQCETSEPCLALQVLDPTLKGFGGDYWEVILTSDVHGVLRRVHMTQVILPVA